MLNKLDNHQALDYILYGGDDYQLCFTIPASNLSKIKQIESKLQQKLWPIGKIIPCSNAPEFLLIQDEQKIKIKNKGYTHF